MPRVVFDANVFVSALIRPEGPPGRLIQRFLKDAAFDLVLSPSIVEEILRALGYRKVRQRVRASVDPALWFEDIVLLADLIAGRQSIERASPDPDDDKYLAAAVEERATFVVTGDPDLLGLKEYEGIRIVKPSVFLTLISG